MTDLMEVVDVARPSTATGDAPHEEACPNEASDDARLEQLRVGVTASSRDSYTPKIAKFLIWLEKYCARKNLTGVLVPGWGDATEEQLSSIRCRKRKSKQEAFIESLLKNPDVSHPPVHFDQLKADYVTLWLDQLRVTRRKAGEKNQKPSNKTLQGYRSAVCNLFRLYDKPVPLGYTSRIAMLSKSLRKERAKEAMQTGSVVDDAKDPLPFAAYREIALAMMKSQDSTAIKAHSMFTLGWNLMCDISNTSTVHLRHVSWVEDALVVRFQHQENEQEGRDRGHDSGHPRHVFANPLSPEICPILALAIFMAAHPRSSAESGDGFLFPGGKSQAGRFQGWFPKFLKTKEVAAVLEKHGLAPEDVDSHAIRQGVVTFCANSTTTPPQPQSVFIRGGWGEGDVQRAYIKYQTVGDQHVGRIATGLPLNSEDFALLPPRIKDLNDDVREALSVCFPNLPRHMFPVSMFLLASLVHHRGFLQETLSAEHKLRHSPLFTHGLLDKFAPYVECTVPNAASESSLPMRATGIPPHVEHIAATKQLTSSIEHLEMRIQSIASETIAGVTQVLEERPLQSANVTPEQLRNSHERMLKELTEIVQGALASQSAHGDGVQRTERLTASTTQSRMYFWADGSTRGVPEGFKLPECSVRMLWTQWMLGQPEGPNPIPPLRTLRPEDLGPMPGARNQRKRLSDIKCLMSKFLAAACAKGIFQKDTVLNLRNVNDAFDQVAADVHPMWSEQVAEDMGASVSVGAKRRRDEISWRTAIRQIRSAKRRKRAQTDTSGAPDGNGEAEVAPDAS